MSFRSSDDYRDSYQLLRYRHLHHDLRVRRGTDDDPASHDGRRIACTKRHVGNEESRHASNALSRLERTVGPLPGRSFNGERIPPGSGRRLAMRSP